MMREGGIAASDLAWTEGMPAWAPVFQVVKPPAGAAEDPGKTRPILAQQYTPPQPAPAPSVTPAGTAYSPPAPASPAPAAPVAPAPAAPAAPAYGSSSPPAPWAQPAGAGQQWPPPPAAPAAPWAAPSPQYASAPGAGPIPPGMHWALVLLLAYVTLGIFGIVWVFKELNFVQRIDPRSPARKLFLIGLGLYILYFLVILVGVGVATAAGDQSLLAIFVPLGVLLGIGAAVCIIMSYFKIRSSLVNYYNTVEPIGLRLSGVMTFFFNFLYFQHHFKRIHDWKTTGYLRPQQPR